MVTKERKEKVEENLASCWVCAGEGEVGPSLSLSSLSSAPSQSNERNQQVDKLVRGCACRGPTAGFAHLKCLIEAAKHNVDTWNTCPTCLQDFTGEVRLGLARARWEIAHKLPLKDGERLNAADCLAQSLQVCLGDQAGALPLFEEVLAISRCVDGNDDVNTVISMNNLASLHQKMGNHHLALPLFEEALSVQQRKPNGKKSQDTLLTINNLAMLHLRTERFCLSLPLAKKALIGRRKTLGTEHADTLESIHNLGLLRWHISHGEYVSFTKAVGHQGTCDVTELKLAKELLFDALKGRRKLFGDAHYLTKESIRALKHANQKLEEICKARVSKITIAKKQRLEETKKKNEAS